MKKILLLGVILFSTLLSFAQHLKIEKEKSLLFITHKVLAKETLYSLGRMYHLTPKEIASANKLSADAGLRIGEQLKIPLKKSNFVQSTPKNKKELEPVYHTIKKGDNLFKLSKNYNKVKEADLKKWNHLSKNIVKPGQEIIVGYVKILSNVDEPKQSEIAVKPKTKPDTTKGQKNTSEKNTASNSAVIPPASEPVLQTSHQETAETPTAQTAVEDSYFAANYSINAATAEEKTIVGSAATFKSTSGWSDKKYYVLMNDLPVETVVKITANGKSVYAKVLESLPDLKDNKNIVCRLSNAAASVLGVLDAKFDVQISFYQ